MKYFAYGSNMNHKQIKERCPDSEFLNRACLDGYRLRYDGYSKLRNSAVANIAKSTGDKTWGGLFEISKNDLKKLDYHEGYPRV